MKTIKSLNYRDKFFENSFYRGVNYLSISIFAIVIGASVVLVPKLLLIFSTISVLFFLGIFKPEIALSIIYLAMLVVGTGVSIFQIGSMNVNLIDGLVLIFVFALIPRLTLKRVPFLKLNTSIILTISLIFLGIIVGLLLGNNPKLMRSEIHVLLYIPIIYVLFLITIKTKKQLKFLTYFIIIATSVAAFKAIYIAFLGYTFPLEGGSYIWQAYSTVNPVFLGQRVTLWGADTFLVITPLFLISYMFYFSLKKFKYIFLSFLIILIALFISFTRTNWLAFSFTSLLVIFYIWKEKGKSKNYYKKFIIIFICVLVLLSILMNMKYGPSSITGIELFLRRISFDPEMGSGGISSRIYETSAVLSEVKYFVLFGKGFGAEYPFEGSHGESKTYWTHNGFAWILLKTGVIGLVTFCFIMIQTFKQGLRYMRKLQSPEIKTMTLGFLGGLFALFLMSLTVNRIISFEGCIYIGTCMGFVELLKSGKLEG